MILASILGGSDLVDLLVLAILILLFIALVLFVFGRRG